MGFSRQEYWSGLPFPSPGDLPDPGTEPMSPALTGWFFTAEPPGKPYWRFSYTLTWNLWETLNWDFLVVGFFSVHLLGGFPVTPSNYKTAPVNSFLQREAAARDTVGCQDSAWAQWGHQGQATPPRAPSSNRQSLLGLPVVWPRASQSCTKLSSSSSPTLSPLPDGRPASQSEGCLLSCSSLLFFYNESPARPISSAFQGLRWIHYPRTFES